MPTRAVDLKSAAAEEPDISAPFNQLMNGIGLSSKDTGGKITFIGADPIFESRFRIGTCISIPMTAAAAGAAIIGECGLGAPKIFRSISGRRSMGSTQSTSLSQPSAATHTRCHTASVILSYSTCT